MQERSGKLQKVFRVFDKDKSHNITKDEFKFMLEYYGMDITDAEVCAAATIDVARRTRARPLSVPSPRQCTTIFRNYDKERSGKLSFAAFCSVFAEDPTGDTGGACKRRVRAARACVRACGACVRRERAARASGVVHNWPGARNRRRRGHDARRADTKLDEASEKDIADYEKYAAEVQSA